LPGEGTGYLSAAIAVGGHNSDAEISCLV